MSRAQGARSVMGLAFETIYGTPPGSGFYQVPFVNTDLGTDQPLLENEVLGFGRDPIAPDRDAPDTDGSVVVPIDINNFGLWLKAAFGEPDTVGAVQATGSITFSEQPAVDSVVVINGTAFTFKASGATGNESNIGVSLTATLAALAVVLNASVVSGVALATYTSDATHLIATFDAAGVGGNAFTMSVGQEMISIWDNMQAGGWSNDGATGSNDPSTFENFTHAYKIGNTGAGIRRHLAGVTVTPGATYRIRAWLKAGTDTEAQLRCRLTGGLDSYIRGPFAAPVVASEAGGDITNIEATDLGEGVWLWEFDIEVGSGLTNMIVAPGNRHAGKTVILFGASSTVASTAVADLTLSGGTNAHVFTSGSWDIPSVAIETQMPEIPKYSMFEGAVLDSIGWEMRRKGHLQATVKLVARTEVPDVSSQAGALTKLPYKRFSQFHGAIARNGATLANITQARFAYMNNLDVIDSITGDGTIGGADPTIGKCTLQITSRFAETTLIDQAIAGESCSIVLVLEISDQERMEVTLPAIYLPRPRTQISGPGGIEVTFDCQAAQTVDGDPMVTIALTNDVEAY